ncbi:hypothetical protein [Ornithinibacillus contaminans]|nr:hypothetical protein [Ornithinibacillus contaminans]
MKNCLQSSRSLEFFKEIEWKLERNLTTEELKFLHWLFNRYQEEQNQQSA